jgi:hypothetical protein
MLVVTVDLVPGGFEPMRRTIGLLRIANVSDLADVSDYCIETRRGEHQQATVRAAGGPRKFML